MLAGQIKSQTGLLIRTKKHGYYFVHTQQGVRGTEHEAEFWLFYVEEGTRFSANTFA